MIAQIDYHGTPVISTSIAGKLRMDINFGGSECVKKKKKKLNKFYFMWALNTLKINYFKHALHIVLCSTTGVPHVIKKNTFMYYFN